MPITAWNLVSQAASIRHVGFMAQDFHAAFRPGGRDCFSTATHRVPAGTNDWQLIPPPDPTKATDCVVTEPAPLGNRFYRLRKP